MQKEFLTKTQIESFAPAVFGQSPHPHRSDKYVFAPTFEYLKMLEDAGYGVVSAKQGISRVTGTMTLYGRHILRLRKFNAKPILEDLFEEIIIDNSHNGISKLNFLSGIFKEICANGMTIAEAIYGKVNVKHISLTQEDIHDLIFNHLKNANRAFEKVNDYKTLILTEEQKDVFAWRAKKAVWNKSKDLMNSGLLLEIRRTQDDKSDLFQVFNVIQENVIKGGLQYQTAERRVKTKPIQAIKREQEINWVLWGLMSKLYEEWR